MSISIKQIKNLLSAETTAQPPDFNNLTSKVNERQKYEHQVKREAHSFVKHEIENRRGPGMYETMPEQKLKTVPKEVYQFFGSTCDRKEMIVPGEMSKNPNMGPGVYDTEKPTKKNGRSKTAAFIGRRPSNVFGDVPDHPAPTDYNAAKNGFSQKLWQSNVQAFGNTERRFAFSQKNVTEGDAEPGPGHYKTSSGWVETHKPYVAKEKRSRFKSSSTEATFKSKTDRTIGNLLSKGARSSMPPPGAYEQVGNLAQNLIQGGAPNNFLLMKNDRLVAPFQSTVQKGWLSTDKGKFRNF